MSAYVVVNRAERQKKRKKAIKKLLIALVFFVVLAVAFAFWMYWRSMTPTILDIAAVQVQSESTRAINEAVLSVFESGVSYSDLVTIEKNTDNEVVLLTANSVLTNSLARNTSLLVQAKINKLFENSIEIPIGTLSGVPLLNEMGPNVCIAVSPVGSVSCSFVSEFASAGINQTLHRIYLNVNSRVDLIVPTLHHTVEICTPILICETVIVGKVPQTFLQGGFVLGTS